MTVDCTSLSAYIALNNSSLARVFEDFDHHAGLFDSQFHGVLFFALIYRHIGSHSCCSASPSVTVVHHEADFAGPFLVVCGLRLLHLCPQLSQPFVEGLHHRRLPSLLSCTGAGTL
jgi:hypothetical protein